MKAHHLNESLKDIIKDRVENHGFPLEDYLEKPPAPLKTRFIVIPSIIFAISITILCFIAASTGLTKLFYVISFGSGTWLCASTQIRFKNVATTFYVATGLILTVLIAGGIINPREAVELVKNMKGK